MAVPIFDTIADLIVARLSDAVWTTSYKIKEIERPNQKHGNARPGPWKCLVQLIDLDPGENYEEEADQPFYRMTATYAAGTEILQPEDDQEPHDRLASYFIFDMAKAITTPATSWHTWGENALNSRWRPLIALDPENGSILVVGLLIEVDVSVKSTDPFISRG